MTETRISLDKYFMEIAHVVSKRSTCLKRQVGAVAVKDKRIICTGYNGAPKGLPDCLQHGCLRADAPPGTLYDKCRAVHSEHNVIIQAATQEGTSLEGVTLYCTSTPCGMCARMLVNAGIVRYVSDQRHPNSEFDGLFKQAGIKVKLIATTERKNAQT